MSRRRADLKLSAEGEVEGTVEYLFTGHAAAEERARYESITAAQMEEDWKARMSRFGDPTISKFEMVQKDDASLPLIVRMNVSATGFCARTGKRILLEPAFFEHNGVSRFTEVNRKWDVYFHYAFSEDDEVTIELPEGWELDKPTAPRSSKLSEIGNYEAKVRVTTDKRKVLYSRKFSWGDASLLVIPAKSYAGVKAIFDFVHEQDHHVLTLTRGGPANASN